MNALTAERVRDLLVYDHATGHFTWRVERQGGPRGRMRVGERAGTSRPDGRVLININGRPQFAHRLAWLYVHGRWPSEIDHIDLNPANNALSNLREATREQNMRNVRVTCKSKTGFRGVKVDRRTGIFTAYLGAGGKHHELGRFRSDVEAARTYDRAAASAYGEFARLNFPQEH